MRILTLILVSLLFISCDNFNKNQEGDKKTSGVVITDMVSDSILKDSNTESNDIDIPILIESQNSNEIVTIKQDKVQQQELRPEVSELTMTEEEQRQADMIDKQQVIQQQKSNKPQQTKIQSTTEKKYVSQVTTIQKVKHTDNSSSVIIVGSDKIGQGLSPRSYIHMSFAVFENKSAPAFIEFQVYAVPVNARLSRTGYYLLGYNKFARIIKGQAQFTRYWNGKNSRGQFFKKGKYNIYLWYKVKDKNGKVLYTAGRYWGKSRKYYLNLY